MNRLRKSSDNAGVASTVMLLAFAIVFSGCGGGGGGDTPPPIAKDTVTVIGTVTVNTSSSPLQGAECRFVDSQGQEQGKATADGTGRYTLAVAVDVEGEIRCTPAGFSNLALTTYSSTQGMAAGETLDNEDVTLFSTVAAQVIASEAADAPAARKTQVLAALAKGQDPDLNLVAGLSEKLYMALLHNNLDIDFSGSAAAQAGNGGISGHVRTGVDELPITGARCAFVMDGPPGQGGSVLHAAALADFSEDGELSRPDLQAVQQQINADCDGRQQEIIDALARVFPNGIGRAYTTFSDENGAYFLAVPAGLSGYVCCTPPDQEKMMLAAYVPGRAEGASLSGQDVTPATTVHSILIAGPLSGEDVDIAATRDDFLQNIAGLQIQMLQADNAVTGFELMPDTAPADKEAGLAAFSATALFNTLYHNQLDVDFPAVLENFLQGRSLDPERLRAQGVGADDALACIAVVTDAIDQAEAGLGTQLGHALSTARINVTLMDKPGGTALPGFTVTISETDLACRGCETPTDDQGKVSLFISGLTEKFTNIILTASDIDGRQESIVQKIQVAPMATLDILMACGDNSCNTIQSLWITHDSEYDGSGTVTSYTGDIDCYIGNGDIYEMTDNGGGGCIAQFVEPTSLILTAVASESTRFVSWDGACTGTEPTCTVTISDPLSFVCARFEPICEEIRAERLYDVYPTYSISSADGENILLYDNIPKSCSDDITVTATTASDWLTITEMEDDAQDARFSVHVSPNPESAPRSGTIQYNDSAITIVQDGQPCAVNDYGIAPVTASFESTGGTATIEVHAPETCPWNTTAEEDWITITSEAAGNTGNGAVTYSVSENTSEAGRTGIITIAGTQYMVTQNDAASNSPLALSIHGQGEGSGVVEGELAKNIPQYRMGIDSIQCSINGAYGSGKCHLTTIPGNNVRLQAEVETWEDPDTASLFNWDSIFSNWTGGCSSSLGVCDLVLDQPQSVGAHFIVAQQAELMVRSFSINSDYIAVATPIEMCSPGNDNTACTGRYQLRLTIGNMGGEAASSFSIGLYVSSDAVITTDDTLLAHGRRTIASLPEKENSYDVFENLEDQSAYGRQVWIPSDLRPGPAYLGVIVDEFDDITEDVEANNTYAVPVYLIPSD